MLSDVDEIPAIQLGELTLRFELEDLDDFGREVAEKELRETPERRASAIEELRNLLKGENLSGNEDQHDTNRTWSTLAGKPLCSVIRIKFRNGCIAIFYSRLTFGADS